MSGQHRKYGLYGCISQDLCIRLVNCMTKRALALMDHTAVYVGKWALK